MMYLLLAVALSLVHVLPHASAAYIVVYTVPTSGHVNPVLPLALELQRRGHQVFFTFFDDELHLIKGYDFQYISLGPKSVINKTRVQEITAHMCQNPTDVSAILLQVKEEKLVEYGPVFTKFNASFHAKRPDLVITDHVGFPASDIGHIQKNKPKEERRGEGDMRRRESVERRRETGEERGEGQNEIFDFIIRKLNIPVVMVVHTMEMLASMLPPAPHLPAFLSGKLFVEFPSYYEQIENMITPYIMMAKMIPIYFALQEERAKYGVVHDHQQFAQMIMTSVWGYEIARPIPPNMQLVGNMWPLEDPNEEWKSEIAEWLDSSNTPVLYVALGSKVVVPRDLLHELMQGLKLASEKLNIRVLWMLRDNQQGREEVVKENKNKRDIRIESWGDQRRILAHKNVFCFLSHGGQNSISESLARGKPLIIMPFFGDQMSNAALVIYSGSGTRLLVQGLTRGEVVKTIKEVQEDIKRYKKGAERIAMLMREAGGAKRAADIAEQTIRIGVTHLLHPKDNTAVWIKALPYLFLSLLLIFLYKIIKFFIFGIFTRLVASSKSNIKVKRT